MEKYNIFDNIPDKLDEEQFQPLLETGRVRIERIVSRGQRSPDGFWYDQAWDEWVVLLQGAAALTFEGQEGACELRPGDHVLIPAHTRHRVEWTAPGTSIWLAVHLEPPDGR